MAFNTDVQALKTRADTLRADIDATLSQLATALFNRLRPLAALDWLPDADLQQACQAFAGAALRSAVTLPPQP